MILLKIIVSSYMVIIWEIKQCLENLLTSKKEEFFNKNNLITIEDKDHTYTYEVFSVYQIEAEGKTVVEFTGEMIRDLLMYWPPKVRPKNLTIGGQYFYVQIYFWI